MSLYSSQADSLHGDIGAERFRCTSVVYTWGPKGLLHRHSVEGLGFRAWGLKHLLSLGSWAPWEGVESRSEVLGL